MLEASARGKAQGLDGKGTGRLKAVGFQYTLNKLLSSPIKFLAQASAVSRAQSRHPASLELGAR